MQVGPSACDVLAPEVERQIHFVLTTLEEAGVAFLVGGAFAMGREAGIVRWTKDLDLFLLPADVAQALRALSEAGLATEETDPRWLAKAAWHRLQVDLVFSSANQLCRVDETWFRHAPRDVVAGVAVSLCPAEEMIWQKCFIQERERYDGADVQHLFRAQAHALDWRRMLQRFAGHEPVLLSQLILFGYVYPTEHEAVPSWVYEELAEAIRLQRARVGGSPRLCRGPWLSRTQYEIDIGTWEYVAPRPPDAPRT